MITIWLNDETHTKREYPNGADVRENDTGSLDVVDDDGEWIATFANESWFWAER